MSGGVSILQDYGGFIQFEQTSYPDTYTQCGLDHTCNTMVAIVVAISVFLRFSC